MWDNYTEETQPLFKLLRTEAFRFIIIRYNHYSLLQQLEKDLQTCYPSRPLQKIDVAHSSYPEIMAAYTQLGQGFLLLEQFEDLFKEERDALGEETAIMQANNERRRGITAGLNLHRDKLARSPIAMIAFIASSTEELYARKIMEKMPDLWSFRSLMLDLKQERQIADIEKGITTPAIRIDPITEASSLGGTTLEEKRKELARLLQNLAETPAAEIELRLSLYPQIVDLQVDTGNYRAALTYLDAWYALAGPVVKSQILLDKGDVWIKLGDLQQALLSFQECLQASQSLLTQDSSQDRIKNRIALANERLGDTYRSLGQLEQAMRCFENYQHLAQELHTDFPEENTYKNNLAISYSKLGETHAALGNLEKALQFFEQYNELEQSLYADYPQNVSFKNGLAISYSKLGETHSALGNLEKALHFFEKYNELEQSLYVDYPQNVRFKKSLAISYEKLGSTHSALGNLEKALQFFEDRSKLGEELYADYPQNVSFKNGLALSYQWLGWMLEKLERKEEAIQNYKLSKSLLTELIKQAPKYIKFKNNLEWVKGRLRVLNP